MQRADLPPPASSPGDCHPSPARTETPTLPSHLTTRRHDEVVQRRVNQHFTSSTHCRAWQELAPAHSPSISMTENEVCVRAPQHFMSPNPWCQGSPAENCTSTPSSRHDQMQCSESMLVCTQVPVPLPPNEQGLVGRWPEPPSQWVLDWRMWREVGLVSIPPPSALPWEVNPVGSWASSYTWHLWGRMRW